jgi:hypothetical protein
LVGVGTFVPFGWSAGACWGDAAFGRSKAGVESVTALDRVTDLSTSVPDGINWASVESLKLCGGSFSLNLEVTEKTVIEQVVAENWARTEVGVDLWNQCEKLRELVLGDRMPIWADEDRKRIHDSSEALAARGDWHLDPGTIYHRKIKKPPNLRCPVPV